MAEEAKQKLIKEETERRVLFNKYQELKGNIRVMCRVRPVLDESEGSPAQLQYPDEKTSAQIDVVGPEEKSSLGQITRKTLPFEFDRVFDPSVANEEVFGEISQLVQSALDGYNVCIFCYGQTGSGKTYTMSSPDGMIPRATHMIYETITKLKEKSWTYTMEGSFVEVYNEELRDLLAQTGEAKKRIEIRHDDVKKQTALLNCRSVTLTRQTWSSRCSNKPSPTAPWPPPEPTSAPLAPTASSSSAWWARMPPQVSAARAPSTSSISPDPSGCIIPRPRGRS